MSYYNDLARWANNKPRKEKVKKTHYREINGIHVGSHYKGGTPATVAGIPIRGILNKSIEVIGGGLVSFSTDLSREVEVLAIAAGTKAFMLKVRPVNGHGTIWVYAFCVSPISSVEFQ